MTYYVTLEVRTTKKLNDDQRDALRDHLLAALDEHADELPYGADVVTAELSTLP